MSAHRAPVPLRAFFAGIAEHAFEVRVGLVDPPLVDYLVELLVRFLRSDAVFTMRDLEGRRLDEVTDMVVEADARVGEARRETHRLIGDFTLFWVGVYPEALLRLRAADRKDRFVDFRQQGKRAYYIASTIPSEKSEPEGAVLQRLSHEFDACVYGLGEVRREWERREPGGPSELFVVN